MLAFDYTPRGQISTATAYSASTPAEAFSEITYAYDGFANLNSETLDPRPDVTPLFAKTVTYGWQWYQESAGKPKQNRLTDITYPSGRGFSFDYTRDGQTWTNAIGRMTGMSEVGGTNNPLIAYTTTGGGRNVKKVWGGNDVTLDYTTPNALDRFGRVAAMTFTSGNNPGAPLHMYEYEHDANGNRTSAFIVQAGDISGYNWQRSYIYGYDNLNRLVFAECGEHALEGKIADGGTGQAWNLDVLGNWSGGSSNDSFISYTVGSLAGNDPGYDFGTDTWIEKRHDTTDEANRINTLRTEANGEPVENDDFYYDAAGNLVLDDEKFYKYDAWNRVVEVHEKGDYHVDAAGALAGSDLGSLIGQYEYDALGRRIAKTLGTAESPTDYFYYDGHRVLEHHKHDGTSLALYRQYVYGLDYIDEVVAYYDSDDTPTNPHFILQDANYNVVGVTDHEGYLEQQYAYQPYGGYLAIEDGTGAGYENEPANTAFLALSKGHQGLWFDPETGLYFTPGRYYDPILGRWLQRDPYETGLMLTGGNTWGGYPVAPGVSVDGMGQYGDGPSLYEYILSAPHMGTDPTGCWFSGLPGAGGVGGVTPPATNRWTLAPPAGSPWSRLAWATTKDDTTKALISADESQLWHWSIDWGDDDYGDAIGDVLYNRETALDTLLVAYEDAIKGRDRVSLYGKLAAYWAMTYATACAPETNAITSAGTVIGGKFARYVRSTRVSSAGARVRFSSARVRAGKGVNRPTVTNPKLRNIVDDLYKGAKTSSPIGTGSTADAIRYETRTGQQVGGRWHTRKGQEYARALEKWLRRNPNASLGDKIAARRILDDLRSALAGN